MSETNEHGYENAIINVNGVAGRLGNAGNTLCLYASINAIANAEVLADFLYSTLYGNWPGLLAQLDPSISYSMLEAIDEFDIDLQLEHDEEEEIDEPMS